MFHRESGVLKTTYEADMALYPLPIARWTVAAVAVVFFAVIPLVLHQYYLSLANLVWIAVIGALGLNILVGYTGQVSIGHGAFMSVGAYTAANLITRLDAPFWLALPAGGAMAALIGAVIGSPSLRIKGLYLAIATLAGQLIIEWTINHVPWISGGVQASIEVPRPTFLGAQLKTQMQLYLFLLFFAAVAIVAPSTWCAAGSAAPSSPSATRTSPPRSSASTSFATSCSPSRCRRSTPASPACSTPTISALPITTRSRSPRRSTPHP